MMSEAGPLFPFIHLSNLPMLHHPRTRRRPVERQAALWNHLCRSLRKASCRTAWTELAASERAVIADSLPLLEETIATAKAALSQDWFPEDRQPSPAIRTADQTEPCCQRAGAPSSLTADARTYPTPVSPGRQRKQREGTV
jgi:hypothetical protein